MSQTLYQIYKDSVFTLAKTMVINSRGIATGINNTVAAAKYVVNPNDPASWKYYLNMSGKYHQYDLDQISKINASGSSYIEVLVAGNNQPVVINMTLENMAANQSIANEYAYGTNAYIDLVTRYPNHEELILGLLNPIDISLAVNAADGDILYMGGYFRTYLNGNADTQVFIQNSVIGLTAAELIEENETNLIPQLQTFVSNFLARWNNIGYAIIDNMYTTALMGILYMQIPVQIFNIRLRNCKTRYVHSYHIQAYFASHGRLDQYVPALTRQQLLWVYRNMEYLEANAGKQSTFQAIIDNVLTPEKIPLDAYRARHQLTNMPNDFFPIPAMVRVPLNNAGQDQNDEWDNVTDIVQLEVPLARENDASLDTITQISDTIRLSNYDDLSTKIVQSTMENRSDYYPYTRADMLMALWLVTASKGTYTGSILINSQIDETIYLLTPLNAYILAIYAMNKGYAEIVLDNVPTINATFIPKSVDAATMFDLSQPPTMEQMLNDVDGKYVSAAQITRMIGEQTPEFVFNSPSEFYNGVIAMHGQMMAQYDRVCQTPFRNARAYLEDIMQMQYWKEVPCELLPGTVSYADWFVSVGIDLTHYSRADLVNLATQIITKATGNTNKTQKQIAALQTASLAILGHFSSYTLQILQSIAATSPYICGFKHLRLDDLSITADPTTDAYIKMQLQFDMTIIEKQIVKHPIPQLQFTPTITASQKNTELTLNTWTIKNRPTKTVIQVRMPVIRILGEVKWSLGMPYILTDHARPILTDSGKVLVRGGSFAYPAPSMSFLGEVGGLIPVNALVNGYGVWQLLVPQSIPNEAFLNMVLIYGDHTNNIGNVPVGNLLAQYGVGGRIVQMPLVALGQSLTVKAYYDVSGNTSATSYVSAGISQNVNALSPIFIFPQDLDQNGMLNSGEVPNNFGLAIEVQYGSLTINQVYVVYVNKDGVLINTFRGSVVQADIDRGYLLLTQPIIMGVTPAIYGFSGVLNGVPIIYNQLTIGVSTTLPGPDVSFVGEVNGIIPLSAQVDGHGLWQLVIDPNVPLSAKIHIVVVRQTSTQDLGQLLLSDLLASYGVGGLTLQMPLLSNGDSATVNSNYLLGPVTSPVTSVSATTIIAPVFVTPVIDCPQDTNFSGSLETPGEVANSFDLQIRISSNTMLPDSAYEIDWSKDGVAQTPLTGTVQPADISLGHFILTAPITLDSSTHTLNFTGNVGGIACRPYSLILPVSVSTGGGILPPVISFVGEVAGMIPESALLGGTGAVELDLDTGLSGAATIQIDLSTTGTSGPWTTLGTLPVSLLQAYYQTSVGVCQFPLLSGGTSNNAVRARYIDGPTTTEFTVIGPVSVYGAPTPTLLIQFPQSSDNQNLAFADVGNEFTLAARLVFTNMTEGQALSGSYYFSTDPYNPSNFNITLSARNITDGFVEIGISATLANTASQFAINAHLATPYTSANKTISLAAGVYPFFHLTQGGNGANFPNGPQSRPFFNQDIFGALVDHNGTPTGANFELSLGINLPAATVGLNAALQVTANHHGGFQAIYSPTLVTNAGTPVTLVPILVGDTSSALVTDTPPQDQVIALFLINLLDDMGISDYLELELQATFTDADGNGILVINQSITLAPLVPILNDNGYFTSNVVYPSDADGNILLANPSLTPAHASINIGDAGTGVPTNNSALYSDATWAVNGDFEDAGTIPTFSGTAIEYPIPVTLGNVDQLQIIHQQVSINFPNIGNINGRNQSYIGQMNPPVSLVPNATNITRTGVFTPGDSKNVVVATPNTAVFPLLYEVNYDPATTPVGSLVTSTTYTGFTGLNIALDSTQVAAGKVTGTFANNWSDVSSGTFGYGIFGANNINTVISSNGNSNTSDTYVWAANYLDMNQGAVAWSPDGALLACGSPSQLIDYSSGDINVINALDYRQDHKKVAFTADGSILWTTADLIGVGQYQSGSEVDVGQVLLKDSNGHYTVPAVFTPAISTLTPSGNDPRIIAVSSDNQFVYVGDHSSTVMVYQRTSEGQYGIQGQSDVNYHLNEYFASQRNMMVMSPDDQYAIIGQQLFSVSGATLTSVGPLTPDGVVFNQPPVWIGTGHDLLTLDGTTNTPAIYTATGTGLTLVSTAPVLPTNVTFVGSMCMLADESAMVIAVYDASVSHAVILALNYNPIGAVFDTDYYSVQTDAPSNGSLIQLAANPVDAGLVVACAGKAGIYTDSNIYSSAAAIYLTIDTASKTITIT